MDELIISSENNILHIYNEGYTVDFTFYNSKGHNIDGGILESSHNKFDNDKVINEIISMFKDNIKFSEPFLRLTGEKANNLLELIEMEDYKNTQEKVNKYVSSIKDKSDIVDHEMELLK